MSKNKFKKLIKKKINIAAIKYLQNLQKSHNKTKVLKFDKIKRTDYLSDERLTVAETKLLFSLRSRMFPVINNFRNNNAGENLDCRLCRNALEDQKHLMQCQVLKSAIPELNSNSKIKYEHIFGKLNEKVNAAKLLLKIVREREKLLFTLSIGTN